MWWRSVGVRLLKAAQWRRLRRGPIATLAGLAVLVLVIRSMQRTPEPLIDYSSPPTNAPPLHPICAFANAESMETAMRTARQWPQFPIWFSVWRERVQARTILGRIHIMPAAGSTHADGWRLAVEAAKASDFECEYYFAMDDDLTWSVTSAGRSHFAALAHRDVGLVERFFISPTELLVSFLAEYRPALTVFPWPWGDVNHENMTRMNAKYSGQLVQPATGFDNGCMIMHRSVVDFFVPVWLGTGYAPKFIVQHTFQNFFAPFLFRGSAVRLNGLRYFNPPAQRHPYDAVDSYIDFLIPASKCGPHQWGPQLAPSQVDWEVRPGQPPYSFSDLYHIATFFNISHSAIRRHPALTALYRPAQIAALEQFSETVLTVDDWCTGPRARSKLFEAARNRPDLPTVPALASCQQKLLVKLI